MFGSARRNPKEPGTFAVSKAGENLLGGSKHVKYFEIITREPATVIVNNNDEPLKARHVDRNSYHSVNNIPNKAEFLYTTGITESAPNGKFGGIDAVCIKENGIEYFIEFSTLDTRQ